MRRAAAALGLLLAFGGCGYVSFSRRMDDREILLRQEVRSFYNSMQLAYGVGNADAVVALYWSSMTHPVSRDEMAVGIRKFFSKNKTAHFHVKKLEIESIGPVQAVVILTYGVETPNGKWDYGGTERQTLTRGDGHWYIASVDKVLP